MDSFSDRKGGLAIAGLLVGATLLFGLMFLGGQTSKILSTVGASVGPPSGYGDTTRDGSTDSGANAAATPGSRPAGGQVADAAAAAPGLLIVRTGELTIQVADLTAAVRDGDAAVIGAGGYVSASDRAADGDSGSASATYRIPSAAWTSTLAALRQLATKVVSEQVKTEEVSGQVVDLTAHIANLRATEAALQAIMARATKIDDVLAVQKQLTETRGDIEKLVADKQHLEDRASYGSLTVTYRLPVAPKPTATPVPVKAWDPGDDVARASDRLVHIGQTTTSVGIWLAIIGLPVAFAGLVLLLVGWQVVRVGRWILRRREPALETGA